MAALRTQFNLTQQEVSERLHIRPRYVSAIEEARYDLMPGKVYARGYVYTYAEFLGLDAEQVTALCFGNETSAATAAHRPPPDVGGAAQVVVPQQWRGLAVAAVVVLAVALILSQLFKGPEAGEKTAVDAVAPVPEAMLQSVRNLAMPIPSNYDCLTSNGTLRCFYADGVSRLLTRLTDEVTWRFLGEPDLAEYKVQPATIEDEGASEEPAAAVEEPVADIAHE